MFVSYSLHFCLILFWLQMSVCCQSFQPWLSCRVKKHLWLHSRYFEAGKSSCQCPLKGEHKSSRHYKRTYALKQYQNFRITLLRSIFSTRKCLGRVHWTCHNVFIVTLVFPQIWKQLKISVLDLEYSLLSLFSYLTDIQINSRRKITSESFLHWTWNHILKI